MSKKMNLPTSISRSMLVLAAALSIGFVGTIGGGITPAAAAPLQEHQFIFTDPKGTDWEVPAGVTEVLVGIRGGDGGCHHCSQPGGQGQSYLLEISVKPGDTLTIYPGTTPAAFARTAGLGFVDGGKGGDKSRSAGVGAGGGGAGAVKLNGELLAVAGGGGGGGGGGGDREFRPFNVDFDFGGHGGDARNGDAPTWGEGKHAGHPGTNGKDESSFSRYHASGGNGGNAGTLTSGGGGGAGGGGWPASGTGGGAGKKRLGFGAGSGGGAGMSWVNEDHGSMTVLETGTRPQFDWHYSGPLATDTQARVTIPLQPETEFSGPAQVATDASFELQARSVDPLYGEATIDGTFELFRNGEIVADGVTDGELTIPVQGLGPGEYTFTYKFSPRHKLGEYWNDRAATSSEIRVSVTAPAMGSSTVDEDLAPQSEAPKQESGAPSTESNSDDSSSGNETQQNIIGDDDSCNVELEVVDTVQWK